MVVRPDIKEKCPYLIGQLKELRGLRDQMKKSFAKSLRINDFSGPEVLKKMVKPLVVELREVFPGLSPVEKKLMQQLEKDYQDSLDTLSWYGVLDGEDGKSYKADYLYKDRNGKSCSITAEFPAPQWGQISAALKRDRQKLSRIMKLQKDGNVPRLFLVPIGKSIGLLAVAIMNKGNELGYRIESNEVDTDCFIEHENDLKLLPDQLFVVPANNFTLAQLNASKKEDLIESNKGWMMVVAESKEEIDPVFDLVLNEDINDVKASWNNLRAGSQVAKYFEYLRGSGMTGLTVEDYLVMQMDAEKHNRRLDEKKASCLVETYVPGSKIAVGKGNYPDGRSFSFPDDKSRGVVLNTIDQRFVLREGGKPRHLNFRRAVRIML